MTTATDLLAYDPSQVKPGWIAFFVVMILCLATFLLWRSMNTQLGKIRVPPATSFDGNRPGDHDGASSGADESGALDGADASNDSSPADDERPPAG
jgi:hypothetical protein